MLNTAHRPALRSRWRRGRRSPVYTAPHIAVRIQRGGGIWPYETPATSRKGTVPIPFRLQLQSLGDVAGRFLRTSDHRPRRRFLQMPPESLRCKECQTTYPLDARYVCEQCFGPLEVAYASRDGVDADALRRRIQAGPHSLWRYGDFLPVSTPPKNVLPAGWTPLMRADRLAEQLGLEEVWIKNDAANPTHSFKDRVVSVALARARELGFRRSPARRRATWPTRWRPTRPRRGLSPTSSSPPTWRSRRSSPPASTGPTSSASTATTTTSTGCAPSSPASTSGRS